MFIVHSSFVAFYFFLPQHHTHCFCWHLHLSPSSSFVCGYKCSSFFRRAVKSRGNTWVPRRCDSQADRQVKRFHYECAEGCECVIGAALNWRGSEVEHISCTQSFLAVLSPSLLIFFGYYDGAWIVYVLSERRHCLAKICCSMWFLI